MPKSKADQAEEVEAAPEKSPTDIVRVKPNDDSDRTVLIGRGLAEMQGAEIVDEEPLDSGGQPKVAAEVAEEAPESGSAAPASTSASRSAAEQSAAKAASESKGA